MRDKILNIHNILIVLVLLLGFVLRIYRVTEFPNGFFSDEAAIGYNAYKVFTSGKDEHQKSFPVFFQSFGDYRNPIPIYSNIISVAFFGLSEFSVRSTTAIFGLIEVICIYFIGRYLGGRKVGLYASFLLSISPWHIHMSRWGAEYIYFTSIFSLGFLFFLKALKNNKYIFLILSTIIFGICLYTYYTAWLIVPVFIFFGFIIWIIFFNKNISPYKKLSIVFINILLFFSLSYPLIKGIKEGYVLTRWEKIYTKNIDPQKRVTQYKKLFFDHFNTRYLFISGDIGYPGRFITRQFIKSMGFFYIFQAPLIILGLIYSVWSKKKEWFLVIILLFLYPLGSVFTGEGPSTTRSIIGIIPFTLYSAVGLYKLNSYFRKYILLVVILAAVYTVSISVHKYLYHYYKEYSLYSSDFWGWQYGPKDIFKYFMSVEKDYDELIYAGEFNGADIFLPFYTLDKTLGCLKCFGGDIKRLDLNKKQLFVASPGLLKDSWKNPNFNIIKKFYYPDGAVAFQAVVFTKKL